MWAEFLNVIDLKARVDETDIPSKITVNLGMNERCIFARMLNAYSISIDDAGDTLEHILKEGLKDLYNKRFPDNQV